MIKNVLSHTYLTPYELQYKRPPTECLKSILNVLGVSDNTIDSFIKAQSNFIDKAQNTLINCMPRVMLNWTPKTFSLVLLRNEQRTKHSLTFHRDIFQVVSKNKRLYIIKFLSTPKEKLLRVHVSRLKQFEINKCFFTAKKISKILWSKQ